LRLFCLYPPLLSAVSAWETIELAIVSQTDLIFQRREWKRNGKRVVCAVGAFDLLHPGHVRLLEHARDLGDILVVGVQGDVQSNAGSPATCADETGRGDLVNPAAERAEVLDAITAVDYVTQFDELTPREFVARLAPDVLARGGEISSNESDFLDDEAVRAGGGKVVRIPLEPGFSTLLLLERIKNIQA
jgi:rfaE bifunctional protein nucleotidyltransferase chain/domain